MGTHSTYDVTQTDPKQMTPPHLQSDSSFSMLRTLSVLLSFLLATCYGDVTETVSTTSGDVIGAVVTFEGTHSNGTHKR